MIRFRHAPWIVPTLALTLMLGACSTPADLTAPTLEPQFGTADNDFGVDVALGSSGQVYSLSERSGAYRNGDDEGRAESAILRRYSGGGRLDWSKAITSGSCSTYDECDFDLLQVRALAADTRGYSYSLVSTRDLSIDCATTISLYVYKHDAAGNFVRSVYLGHNGQGYGTTTGATPSDVVDIAADRLGNTYVVRQSDEPDANEYCTAALTNVVAKYSPTGALQWQRTSQVGTLRSVTVSSSGIVFVGGSAGVSRYTSSGDLSWTKAGAATDLAAVGTNTVYARNLTTVRKLDANGKQLWSKAQGGLNGMVVGDMTTDGSANVYLTGKYNVSSGNRDVFTRKLSASSGSTVFSKTFGASVYDDARGIATINGSEIYLTGATKGPLAPPYQGGEQDGYVRKLNSGGTPVWTR